jgi:hypothetical protein
LLPLGSMGLIYHFLDHSQTVGLLGWVISSSQGLYLNTGQHKHRKTQTHTSNIHVLSGIRTRDPGFRASEDSICLRPLGYRDRPYSSNLHQGIVWGNGRMRCFGSQFDLLLRHFSLTDCAKNNWNPQLSLPRRRLKSVTSRTQIRSVPK